MTVRRMKAKYVGRCAANGECRHGGKVFPGNMIVWERETKLTWHEGGCEDAVLGNRFGEYEAEQERMVYAAKMRRDVALEEPDRACGCGWEYHMSDCSLRGGAAAYDSMEEVW